MEETPGRVDVALAIAHRAGRLLVARRAGDVHLSGSWEFPGGKILPGEEPAAAAARELREETGLGGGRVEPLVVLVHDYAELPLRFHVFLIHEPTGEVVVDGGREWGWKTLDEVQALGMPPANRGIVRALQWRLRGR